jgi:thermostable 8-oxoguanine DNA glycosylase
MSEDIDKKELGYVKILYCTNVNLGNRNMKAIEYRGNLNDFLISYNYQPKLTKKLDDLRKVNFDQFLVNELVLWKVNRYVLLKNEILQGINNLKTLVKGQHRQGETVLRSLLNANVSGVDLPMASTFLRFRNPKVFQIIDRHAYRAVYGQKYPLYSTSPINRKVSTYFEYLDKLIELCGQKNLEFQTIDRLLYAFDKQKNGKL